MMNCNYAATPA